MVAPGGQMKSKAIPIGKEEPGRRDGSRARASGAEAPNRNTARTLAANRAQEPGHFSRPFGPEAGIQLQRTVGNRVLSRLLTARTAVHREIDPGKLNIVGEDHDKEKLLAPGHNVTLRNLEKATMARLFPPENYWLENHFRFQTEGGVRFGDSPKLRGESFLAEIRDGMESALGWSEKYAGNPAAKLPKLQKILNEIQPYIFNTRAEVAKLRDENREGEANAMEELVDVCETWRAGLQGMVDGLAGANGDVDLVEAFSDPLLDLVNSASVTIEQITVAIGEDNATQRFEPRSLEMLKAANLAKNNPPGIWKVGNMHISDIKDADEKPGWPKLDTDTVTITDKVEFWNNYINKK